MDLSKVLWCDNCSEITIVTEDGNCPKCNAPMKDIGFVEDKVGTKGIGG